MTALRGYLTSRRMVRASRPLTSSPSIAATVRPDREDVGQRGPRQCEQRRGSDLRAEQPAAARLGRDVASTVRWVHSVVSVRIETVGSRVAAPKAAIVR